MGFYFRKSVSFGPLRINFSKSGVSYSAGVKGARISTGPRGTYVNIGSNGIYYRQRIDLQTPNVPTLPPPIFNTSEHTITSGNIDALSDVDSKDFVAELNQKANMISYLRWFGITPMLLFLIMLPIISIENRETVTQPEGTREILTISSPVGANIRSSPDGTSKVLGTAKLAEEFTYLKTSKSKWLEIKFKDTIGYVSNKLSTLSTTIDERQSRSELYLVNPAFPYYYSIGIIFFIGLIIWLNRIDKKRFAMEIQYEMDEQMSKVYEQFGQRFSTFMACARKWQYLNSQQNNDWKRNAGAGKLVSRISIRMASNHQNPMRQFKTNVKIPVIKLRNTELYFLPERLLIKRGNQFAAVFYQQVSVEGSQTRFIEDEGVAGDAKIVGNTWKYVNKSGGPDKRFNNNNRQIPICLYSQYTLRSPTGLYETICTSQIGGFDEFSSFLKQIGQLQSDMTKGTPLI